MKLLPAQIIVLCLTGILFTVLVLHGDICPAIALGVVGIACLPESVK